MVDKRRNGKYVSCDTCATVFYLCQCQLNRSKHHYCSLPCYTRIQNGSNNHHWKGGIRHSKGYIKTWMPDHPNCDNEGYMFEHRLVMETYLGRYLTPKELVHHKNKIKTDNRIENLELVTPNTHPLHHVKRDPLTGRFLPHPEQSNDTYIADESLRRQDIRY